MPSLARRLEPIAAPLVAGVAILVVWESLLQVIDPDGFVLPPPTEIVGSLFDEFSLIWDGARTTGFIIITGLIAGLVVGVVAALLVTQFRLANEIITPLAVALNAVPIIALAPIFNAWFGSLGPRSNQLIVVVLVFFPVFINTAKGLTDVEPNQVGELERTHRVAIGRGAVADHARGTNPQRAALLLHRSEARHLAGGHRGDRRRVLRRTAGRPRADHHPERRTHPVLGGLGRRARRHGDRRRALHRDRHRRTGRDALAPLGTG